MSKKISGGSSYMEKFSEHLDLLSSYPFLLAMAPNFPWWLVWHWVRIYLHLIFFMFSRTWRMIVFALLGFLSPSNRGALATVMIVCWSFFGRYFFDFLTAQWNSWLGDVTLSVGGYISSRLYASLGGTERKKNALITATVLPTYVTSMPTRTLQLTITLGSSFQSFSC